MTLVGDRDASLGSTVSGGTTAVIGATGFVGKALVSRLARTRGASVRCLARDVSTVPAGKAIYPVAVDLAKSGSIDRALDGVDTAYYLVHAMGGGSGFAHRDRLYARRFARAARRSGVRRVVYLGGLYPRDNENLSPHLDSRREVGEILIDGCGALVVRAGIILGRGSASFELMHDLVSRVPVLITPRWISNHCQPIWLGNAVEALARADRVPMAREIDLVGPAVLSYREMLVRLARHLGRTQIIVGVPVPTRSLPTFWLRAVTSVPLPVAQALVASLCNDAVGDGSSLCRETRIRAVGFDRALERVLGPA